MVGTDLLFKEKKKEGEMVKCMFNIHIKLISVKMKKKKDKK